MGVFESWQAQSKIKLLNIDTKMERKWLFGFEALA